MSSWTSISEQLSKALVPFAPPLSITFSAKTTSIDKFDSPMAPATEEGRTGRVPAGCVFWIEGINRTFATLAEDHGNCSVGSFTHGLMDLNTAATKSDVANLVGAKWVREEDFTSIAHVEERPQEIIYGPLADCEVDPDVILLRINAKSLMVAHDSWPTLRIEGKPQCHIVAIALEQRQLAASVGCILSRTRTKMGSDELTLAIPASLVESFIESLHETIEADSSVASYAATDSARFSH